VTKDLHLTNTGLGSNPKFGLEQLKPMLSLMGDPQKSLSFVHVAGTNGKGSTCSFLSHILVKGGFKTGLFTSPYLLNINEQIKINNVDISDEALYSLMAYTNKTLKNMEEEGLAQPTPFEVLTAISFQYFLDQNCDIVILEVGLGGRLDATNVIDPPLVSVFTPISFDHMNFLGRTLKEIAKEKAGIIKKGTTVISAPQEAEAFDVLYSATKKNAGEFISIDPEEIQTNPSQKESGGLQTFDYKDFKNLKISLLGKHQRMNASVAIETALVLRQKGYKISKKNIKEGLKTASWPGRFEVLRQDPPFIIDGAHNVEGAIALNHTLQEYYKNHRRIMILGLLQDKEVDEMISLFLKDATAIITVNPLNERFLPAEILSQKIQEKLKVEGNHTLPVYTQPDFRDGVELAFKLYEQGKGKDTVICSCGSLYYIGEVREYLKCRKRP
jgi:dihydrofolate synthase / folylpolyglutamate synthase